MKKLALPQRTLLMQAPLAWALFASYRRRTVEPRSFLFFPAMGSWFALQMAALAYGRANDCLASRYLDVLLFGIATNFVALAYLWANVFKYWKWPLAILAICWLAALIGGLWNGFADLRLNLEGKKAQSIIQEKNVRGYLSTGDPRWLYKAAYLDIPDPRPERLQMLLDDATIRSILPPALLRPLGDEVAPKHQLVRTGDLKRRRFATN